MAPNSPPAGLTDAKKREFEALAAELRTLRQQAAQAEATQQAAADDGERPDTPAVLINSLGMQLKLVPAGTFRMGQNPSAVVTISAPFYLGVYEVSQAECAALLGERKHPGASGTEADTSVHWASLVHCATTRSPACRASTHTSPGTPGAWATANRSVA